MLYNQIAGQYARIQRTLARIQGTAAEGDGTNVLINGTAYLGVFGAAQVSEEIAVGGGIRRYSSLPLTITRAQITNAAAMHKKRLVRTDMGAPINYTVNSIDDNDPHHWTFLLEKDGL